MTDHTPPAQPDVDRPTFRAWIKAQRKRHDPVGDLARDVMADLRCWRGQTWRTLLLHMVAEHDADTNATKALARAVREYRDETRESPAVEAAGAAGQVSHGTTPGLRPGVDGASIAAPWAEGKP